MQELIDYFNERPEYDKTSEGYEIIEKSKQLLEKEKEQIKKAYKDYHDLGHIFGLDTEQYFNQTYNQNK